MAESWGAASSDKTFDIGFALSGAISAGAYTAGVLDYFFQALHEWQKAKDEWEKAQEKGEPGAPPLHQINVQVVTGASAGAITGALGVVALARGIRPVPWTDANTLPSYSTADGTVQKWCCVLPSLYETWVVRPRMVDPNGGTDFLSSEDLDNVETDVAAPAASGSPPSVVSALNARLLDDIKNKALAPSSAGDPPVARPPYPYIAENLHVYMTVSNLRGIPFEVSFGNSTYGMQTHGDRAHYVIKGLGEAPDAKNEWLKGDSGDPLGIDTLPAEGQEVPKHWDQYGICALASSAFPIGLAPRRIDVPFAYYEHRSYALEQGGAQLRPKFPGNPPDRFAFLNVDGGVINNNPFDYAQYALMGDPKAVASGSGTARRAVLMVSPFPEPPAFLPADQPREELVAVVRALFPALINQARFKVSELVPALDSANCSRFLIAPHRDIPGAGEQKYKIACGLLGGFGGFLDEKFRAHDFQLGRRNCQQFLKTTFGLTPNNKIVQELDGNDRFELSPDGGKYRVVPRLGEAWPEVPLPRWPCMRQSDFDRLMERIEGRLDKVRPRFVQSQTTNGIMRQLLRFGLWWAQDKALNYIKYAILSDLVRRDQIEGWDLPDIYRWNLPQLPFTDGQPEDNVRMVIAELVNPALTFRTAEGIAEKTHLTQEFVRSTLAGLQRDGSGKPYRLWSGTAEDGREIFTLASKMTGFWSWPIVRQLSERWLEAPTIDAAPSKRTASAGA